MNIVMYLNEDVDFSDNLQDDDLEQKLYIQKLLNNNSFTKIKIIPQENIRIKRTKEEKNETRRLYRRLYSKKPHVIAKANERLNNEEFQQKRKIYASRPDIMGRKREQAARAREINRELKKHPLIYSKMISNIDYNKSR